MLSRMFYRFIKYGFTKVLQYQDVMSYLMGRSIQERRYKNVRRFINNEEN